MHHPCIHGFFHCSSEWVSFSSSDHRDDDHQHFPYNNQPNSQCTFIWRGMRVLVESRCDMKAMPHSLLYSNNFFKTLSLIHTYIQDVWKSRKTLRQWWATKDEGKGAKMVTILMILLFSPFTLCTPSVQQILRNTVLYFRYILMCKTIPLVPDAMNEWACKKRVVCCLF